MSEANNQKINETKKCLFCSDEVTSAKILENEGAYAVYDKFPASRGHILVIPKKHSENFFESDIGSRGAMNALAFAVKVYLDEKYSPDGYNILLNCGKDAGQIIFHTHMHVIPRYNGDGKKMGLCGHAK